VKKINKNRLKIGIVGAGAIGTSLAKEISTNLRKDAELAAIYDIKDEKSKILASKIPGCRKLAVKSLSALVRKSRLVIEASSAKSSFLIAKKALSGGCDIMIMSVGGVASRLAELTRLAKTNNARVYIPSGAICGLDALKAAAASKISSVILITRKHPLSFKGVDFIERKKINLAAVKKDKLLFSGSALQAIKFFPQNINVAAALAIAGIGLHKTKVRIIASPFVKKNIHEIRVSSRAANILTRTENILHPENPKTSYLAVLSALATLRQILEPVRIGT